MAAPRPVVVVAMTASLRLMVAQSTLKQQFGNRALALGHEAVAVHAYMREVRHGYFPALDYFTGQPEFDRNLLSTAMDLGRVVRGYAHKEVQKNLIPAFSRVVVKRASSPAYLRSSFNEVELMQ